MLFLFALRVTLLLCALLYGYVCVCVLKPQLVRRTTAASKQNAQALRLRGLEQRAICAYLLLRFFFIIILRTQENPAAMSLIFNTFNGSFSSSQIKAQTKRRRSQTKRGSNQMGLLARRSRAHLP